MPIQINMKMPFNCEVCNFCFRVGRVKSVCVATHIGAAISTLGAIKKSTGRPLYCPLKEVKE